LPVTTSTTPLFSFGGPNNDKNNQSAYATTLFKRTFGGEILTEFREATIFRELHMTRQIENGKAAKFPVFGRASHKYFTPGDDLYTTSVDNNSGSSDLTTHTVDGKTSIIGRSERLIYINELCLAATLVDQVDELMDDYNGVRGIYSQELGRALANNYDQMVAKAIFAAASQTTPPVAGGPVGGGAIAIDLSGATSSEAAGDLLVGALFDSAQKFDEADVPKADRYAAFAPKEYYDLVNSNKAVNRDYAGSGSIAGGSVLSVAGINIVMTNHLPHADNSSGSGTVIDGNRNDDLNRDYGGTVVADPDYLNGLVFQKQAAATASLMDLAFETEWDIRKQAWVMVAKMAVGHGVLRPECAVKITQS
jgi:hypothetical protein